jgi:hypothetical protein
VTLAFTGMVSAIHSSVVASSHLSGSLFQRKGMNLQSQHHIWTVEG